VDLEIIALSIIKGREGQELANEYEIMFLETSAIYGNSMVNQILKKI